jgi:hypothetical protein
MLNVANKPFMTSGIMLNVIMLSVVAPRRRLHNNNKKCFVQLGFSSDGNFWRADQKSSGLTSEWTDTQSSGSNFQWSN